MRFDRVIFLLFCLIAMGSSAQSDTIYTQVGAPRIQFQLQFNTAVDQIIFRSTQGSLVPKNRLNLMNTYKFGLNLRLNENFSFTSRFSHSFSNGLDAYNLFNHRFLPKRGLSFSHLNRDEYCIGWEWGVSYKRRLRDNYWLKFMIGMGRNNYYLAGEYSFNPSYSAYNNAENYIHVDLEDGNEPTKFFVELGISKYFIEAKNFNLSLVYESNISGKFSGIYEINDEGGISKGRIANKGNSLGVGLTYMFGRSRWIKTDDEVVKKANKLAKKNDSLSFLKAKKIVLDQGKKTWNPKSVLFHVNTGLFFTRNAHSDNNFLIPSHFAMSMSQSISAEIGIKNNTFFEFGYSFDRYTVSERLSEEPILRDFIFSASKFNVGFVYRKFHRYSNKPLLNIQIGGSISFLNNPNKIHFEDSFRYSYSGSSYLLSGDKVNNVFPSIYIGIGNEWELNDKLFFSLNSRFQYGIMEVYKTEISRNAGTYFIDGTALTFSLGFKYKFLPQKYK